LEQTATGAASQLPAGAAMILATETVMAAKGDKRFFETHLTPSSGRPQFELQHRGMSYDGLETRILRREKNGRIYPGDERHQVEPADDFLALQGYPRSQYRIKFPNGTSASCNIPELLRDSSFKVVGTKNIDERECLQLASATDRMSLAIELNFALLERELLDEPTGQLKCRYSFLGPFEILPHLWLAKTIKVESFHNGKFQSRSSIELQDHNVREVPESLFSFVFEPGTQIADLRHLPANPDGSRPIVAYTLPNSPRQLDDVIAAAIAEHSGTQLPGRRDWRWLLLLLMANVLLLVPLGTVVVLRRRKPRGH
jgi:hypothetical protein